MVISFILKKTVVERIKVKGEIKKVKTPIWFNMEYNTKSKKAWFVGRNSTPFDIRNLSLSERQDLGEKIEEASGLTKDQTITEEFKEPVISTSERVKENILIQDVSDRFRFPEFKEVFYLGYYHKPTLSGHDETSKQLLKFKNGNEDTINKWISLIIQNCNFPPVDYIVRPLSSEETELTYDKPLDKLGDALYEKYATDYWPDLLTKSRPTKPLKLLDKTARFNEINNVYSFDNSLFPVSYFNNNSLDILIIDDTITTGTTLKEINRAISASIGDDNYNLYIFTLLRTFDSWSNVDQSNIKLNKIFGSN